MISEGLKAKIARTFSSLGCRTSSAAPTAADARAAIGHTPFSLVWLDSAEFVKKDGYEGWELRMSMAVLEDKARGGAGIYTPGLMSAIHGSDFGFSSDVPPGSTGAVVPTPAFETRVDASGTYSIDGHEITVVTASWRHRLMTI